MNGNTETALAKVPVAIGERGITLRSLEELWRFAEMVALSQGKQASKKDVAEIGIKIQAGLEMGMGAMQSVNTIAVVNGVSKLWGSGIISQLRKSGQVDIMEEWYEKHGERLTPQQFAEGWDEDWVACYHIRLKGEKKGHTERYAWAQAKRAGLTNKATYKSSPEKMLMRRAIDGCAFRRAAHLLAGVRSTDDAEVADYEESAVTVSRVGETPAEPDPILDALTEKQQPITPMELQSPPADEPLDGSPHIAEGIDAIDPPEPEEKATPKPKKLTKVQRTQLIAPTARDIDAMYFGPDREPLRTKLVDAVFGTQDWKSCDDAALERGQRIVHQLRLSTQQEVPMEDDLLLSAIAEATQVVEGA